MPKLHRIALFALLSSVLAGCPLVAPPTAVEPDAKQPGAVRDTDADDAPLGDPEFPAPRPIPSRAGELKGTVFGPKAGLVGAQDAAVLAGPTTGLLLSNVATTSGAYRLAAISDQVQPRGEAKVVITDAFGNAISEELTTASDGTFSFSGFLSDERILFVRATYTDSTRPVTLLTAANFPDKGEIVDIKLDPATTLVTKKAIEMVRLSAVDGKKVAPSMVSAMAEVLASVMSPKAVVAAAILPDGKVADGFDTMVKESEPLKVRLAAFATEAGIPAFMDKTPVSTTTVQGTIHDASAKAATGNFKVRLKSLSTSRPYDKTVDAINGVYTAEDVPSEVQIEVTASREGWTSRSRVVVLDPTGQSRVDFGGTGELDFEAPPYFLSNNPEIVSTEPADGTALTENGNLVYKITLSEGLDETNRGLFATSLRVFPANDAADSNTKDTFPATSVVELASSDLNLTKIPYSFAAGSALFDDPGSKATVTWDDTGKVATLTFKAPLLTGVDEGGVYNVALFNMGSPVKDKEGNRFGTDKNGSFTASPETFGIWCGTFKDSFFTLKSTDTTADKRWLATHHLASEFSVPKDDRKPLLNGIAVSETSGFTRIEMSFSEAMAGFAGGRFTRNGVLPPTPNDINFALANFTFAVATSPVVLDEVQLDGATSKKVHVAPDAFASDADYNQEFFFEVLVNASQAELSIDPAKPHIVRLDLRNPDGTAFAFPAALKYIKARVGNIADPTGNKMSDVEANLSIKTGDL